MDDCSEDDTENIVKNIQQTEPQVRYFKHDSNRGAQAARNTGIRAAKGEWIAFLDSDDQWLEDSLRARLSLAIEKKVSAVHSSCYILKDDFTPLQLFDVPPVEGDIYKALLKHPAPVFPSLLIRKEALIRIGYLDEEIIAYQEWDTSIRLAKCYEFAFYYEPTFIYDCRNGGTISKDNLREVLGYSQIIRKFRKEILKNAGFSALSNHYLSIGIKYAKLGKNAESFKFLIKSFFYMPIIPVYFMIKKIKS